MRKTLSRKRKRNPKSTPTPSLQKTSAFPRFTELNGYKLIELNEDEVIKTVSTEQLSNSESNELPLKEEKLSSKEYTRLRGKARSIEGHFTSQQECVRIKENCFNCLMTDFNPNELLYFNNRNDLLCYFQYCFQVKKRLLFTDKVTYLENKSDILKCGNSFLNGWRFFIPKTMCKPCFMRIINMKSLVSHIKTIFSDTDKDSQCKTNYRNYALFSPRFRNAFSLTKRIPNRKALKNAKRNRRIIIENNTPVFKTPEPKNKSQIIIIKDDIQDQNSPVIIERNYNPNIEFDVNQNILTINKKILGDINTVFSNENIGNNLKKKNEINKEIMNAKDKKNTEKKNEKISKNNIPKNEDLLKIEKKHSKNLNKKEEKKIQNLTEEEKRKEILYKAKARTNELDNNKNIYLNCVKLILKNTQSVFFPLLGFLVNTFNYSESLLKEFIRSISVYFTQLGMKSNKSFFEIGAYYAIFQEVQGYIDMSNKTGMFFKVLMEKFTILLLELHKIGVDPILLNSICEIVKEFSDTSERYKSYNLQTRQVLIDFIKFYESEIFGNMN